MKLKLILKFAGSSIEHRFEGFDAFERAFAVAELLIASRKEAFQSLTIEPF